MSQEPDIEVTEVCPVCDRPRATERDWEEVPDGEGHDLCWDGDVGGSQCRSSAVDWRTRCLVAEEGLEKAEQARLDWMARAYESDVLGMSFQDRWRASEARYRQISMASVSLLDSLGEYVRQSMFLNPEWRPGIDAVTIALGGEVGIARIKAWVPCPACQGKGYYNTVGGLTCRTCDGTGLLSHRSEQSG